MTAVHSFWTAGCKTAIKIHCRGGKECIETPWEIPGAPWIHAWSIGECKEEVFLHRVADCQCIATIPQQFLAEKECIGRGEECRGAGFLTRSDGVGARDALPPPAP